MKRVKPTNAKNLAPRMANLLAMVLNDSLDNAMVADHFEAFLNDLLNEDAFGTEGQNDPRGDRRD